MMRQFDSDGKSGSGEVLLPRVLRLCRLANEVEEGYLGKLAPESFAISLMARLRGGRGKVMWLDPEDSAVPAGSAIRRHLGPRN